MTSRLVLIALATLLSLSERANAGVMLYVDFGNNAQILDDVGELTQGYNPNGSASLTANIYLHLTNGSTLYGYQFSVRYNKLALGLNLDTDEAIAAFTRLQKDTRPAFFGGTPNYPVGPFEAPGAPSKIPDLLTNSDFLEMHRFNGFMDLGRVSDARFYKVATITFSVLDPDIFTSGTQLVQPGKFDLLEKLPPLRPDDVLLDTFFSEDKNTLEFTASGGGVSLTSTVPEPTSALILGIIGSLALVRLKRRVAVKAA